MIVLYIYLIGAAATLILLGLGIRVGFLDADSYGEPVKKD